MEVYKKGELHWDELGKILMVLVFLVIILLIIFSAKTKQFNLIESLKNILRFGV